MKRKFIYFADSNYTNINYLMLKHTKPKSICKRAQHDKKQRKTKSKSRVMRWLGSRTRLSGFSTFGRNYLVKVTLTVTLLPR